MIQKCPNCGHWCETEGSGLLKRFGNGWQASVENAAEGASSILGEKVGSYVGGAIGGYTGLIRGAFNSLLGDRYQFKCQSCGYEWGTSDASKDETKAYMAEQKAQKHLYDRITKAEEKNKNAEAIRLLNEFISKYPGVEVEYVYKELAYLYNEIEDYEKTIEACQAGMEALSEGASPSTCRFLCYYLYVAELQLNRIWAARKDALLVARYSEDETLNTPEGENKLKKLASEHFSRCDDMYRQHFLELPYKDRKMLMLVDQYTDLDQTHLDVFQISSLPEGVSFPIGHPVRNQLYVGHPYIPETYVPFETHQLVFIEDKIREFCEIVQCLGANEITIEALNTSKSDSRVAKDTEVSGSATYVRNSGSASTHHNGKLGLVEEISKSMNFHQVYSPYQPAHLPEKTVWYQNEPSWQRLYKQRMAGSLIEHEERIETRKCQVAEGNELNEIKGEFKTLFVEGNGEWSTTIEDSFSQQENAILAIRVRFAPLAQLTGKQTATFELVNSVAATGYLSKDEQEYLDEVKFTLEDGEIGPRERKALARTRARLGISEARAAEIETFAART